MHSIREIASKLGLSVATVSRALDPQLCSRVRESTRQRVLSCCERLNYRPNLAGRSCATGRSYKIGFISGAPLSDFGNVLSAQNYASAFNELQRHGYTALILCADGADMEKRVVDFLRSRVADAYVIGRTLITEKVREAISSTGSKVVTANAGRLAGSTSCLCRDYHPAFSAIWKKIPAAWSSSVVFCGPDNDNTLEKYQAACAAMPSGMHLSRMTILEHASPPEYQRFLAYRDAQRHLDKLTAQRLVWCSSDLVALGICDALSEAGIAVGREIAVVGFDNLEGIIPGEGAFLSTVDSRQDIFGRTAAVMALELLETTVPRCVSIPLNFISRKSF